jgi:hypothetical protein
MQKNKFLKLGISRLIQVEQHDHFCRSAEGFPKPSPSVRVSLWSKPCHALNGRLFFSRRLLITGKKISIAKVALNMKKTGKLDVTFRVQAVKCYIWGIDFYGAETLALRKINHKSIGTLSMWCWRRMEKIILTNRVKNTVLQKVKEERISYIKYDEGRLTGLVKNWVWSSF